MAGPVFSPLALSDLQDILEYISRDNPTAAVSYVELLEEKCQTLARYPLLGTVRDSLAKGLRVFSVGNFAVYYRLEARTVGIERVLHGARDADRLFD